MADHVDPIEILEPQAGVEGAADPAPAMSADSRGRGLSRRHFGYVVAGSTLMVAVELARAETSEAAIPSPPQVAALFDLLDAQNLAALPTSGLIAIVVNEDGTATFAIPRTEVGPGITTSTAMIIAEELDLPVERVNVTLAPARQELVFNQLTGGSSTTFTTFTPIRVAAATARTRLVNTAAAQWGVSPSTLTTKAGVITAADGRTVTYGAIARAAASAVTITIPVTLKARSSFGVIGKGRGRTDARDIVTGAKDFALDLSVPDALPTMVARPPTHNGVPISVANLAALRAMPGVTDVVLVSTGVAIRAKTFGQCIDAVRAVDAQWSAGAVAGASDATVLAGIRKAEIPMVVPKVPILTKTVDANFTFMFRSSAALEPNAAIADVRATSATVWAGVKAPIVAQAEIAQAVGLPISAVKVNVITGGGSFGHKLFADAAVEAARISKAMGKPVKLLWHRADEPRQGRLHPMCTSRVRATVLAGQVLSFEQRHTSVKTDFGHGFGDLFSSIAAKLPTGLGNLSVAETVFQLTQEIPYNFGVVTQLLNETDQRFSTGAMRNIYSPDVRTATELVIDKLAALSGQDPLAFRLAHLKDEKVKAVLRKVAAEGEWGRRMPAGMAQGIAIHKEYKGATAVLVEIDCRPETVNRRIRDGVGGPRVTKAVVGIDAGLVVNPTGVEAQMIGGFNDGLAMALTASCHLKDGHFLEASWDNYFYTRQWNVPQDLRVVIMPSTSDTPGGVGEAGVAASFAAVACAYARATGSMPTTFPINHADPIAFEVKTFIPSVPESPTDGLSYTS
jgi:isoquinoline 1-oxidoreductase beta subunit